MSCTLSARPRESAGVNAFKVRAPCVDLLAEANPFGGSLFGHATR
jgi:hypothetical protein